MWLGWLSCVLPFPFYFREVSELLRGSHLANLTLSRSQLQMEEALAGHTKAAFVMIQRFVLQNWSWKQYRQGAGGAAHWERVLSRPSEDTSLVSSTHNG